MRRLPLSWGFEDVSALSQITKVLDGLCRSHGACGAITRLVTINDQAAYRRRLVTSLPLSGKYRKIPEVVNRLGQKPVHLLHFVSLAGG